MVATQYGLIRLCLLMHHWHSDVQWHWSGQRFEEDEDEDKGTLRLFKNKIIEDGGVTVDFWFIKVHTSDWNSLWIIEYMKIIEFLWSLKSTLSFEITSRPSSNSFGSTKMIFPLENTIGSDIIRTSKKQYGKILRISKEHLENIQEHPWTLENIQEHLRTYEHILNTFENVHRICVSNWEHPENIREHQKHL